jgi:hypothetical protein
MCSRRVVFPLPKNPDISVTGSCLNPGSVTAISSASWDFSALTSNIGTVLTKDSYLLGLLISRDDWQRSHNKEDGSIGIFKR